MQFLKHVNENWCLYRQQMWKCNIVGVRYRGSVFAASVSSNWIKLLKHCFWLLTGIFGLVCEKMQANYMYYRMVNMENGLISVGLGVHEILLSIQEFEERQESSWPMF